MLEKAVRPLEERSVTANWVMVDSLEVSPVRYRRQEGIDHAEPELRVAKGLEDLGPLPFHDDISTGLILEDAGGAVHLSAISTSAYQRKGKTDAILFSSLLNQMTSFGLPSRKKHMMARTMVQVPRKKLIYLHGDRPLEVLSACEPMP